MPEKILGIDPGSRATGIALLEESDGSYVASLCDVIRTDSIEDHTDRLQRIFEQISGVIKEFRPTSCAVETPVYGVDPLAMLKLGRAQAAAILAATNEGLLIREYYPKAVKKAITGNGNASKQQVAFMLRKMIRMPEEDISMDASDALAVAWCHHTHMLRIRQTGDHSAKSGKKYHQNNKSSDWNTFVRQNPDRIRSS